MKIDKKKRLMIYGIMVHDPLVFEASIFSGPTDPPMCLKMPKYANFSPLWVSDEKNHLKVGVHREKFKTG